MLNAPNLILVLATLFVLAGAAFDLRTGHIPNRLTLGGFLLGAVAQIAIRLMQPQAEDLWITLGRAFASVAIGALACGLVPYLLFLRSGIGGGDVKLLAAVGAFLGPLRGLEVQLYAFVAMALFAPARLAYEGRLLQVLGNSAALLLNPILPKERRRPLSPELFCSLKFGPAVFAGALLVTLLNWRSA